MATDTLIEQRLTAVESTLADLQRQLNRQTPAANWLDRFKGAFKDEPAFDEVIRYGRAIRETERITRNSQDFNQVPGLVIEDWTI